MRQVRPSDRHRQFLVIALLWLLTSATNASAQDRAKIEIVPILGHSSLVSSMAFSADGARVLSGSLDTTVRIWNPETGQLLASLLAARDGEWLAITPAGFFAASRKGAEMLGIVRGFASCGRNAWGCYVTRS